MDNETKKITPHIDATETILNDSLDKPYKLDPAYNELLNINLELAALMMEKTLKSGVEYSIAFNASSQQTVEVLTKTIKTLHKLRYEQQSPLEEITAAAIGFNYAPEELAEEELYKG